MQQIGRYQVLEEIARGGMGVVFKAHDPATRRTVAIKLLLGSEQLGPTATKRLQREAQSLAQLRHPGVVTVHELGEHGGVPFVVLDYVSGASLQEYLDRDGAMGALEAVEIMIEVAAAVSAAHAVGVLHRDLKPSNVILTPRGAPILIDFGLSNALATDSASRLTRTGQFLGTPGYWAPELARGARDEISSATDVYGLGATLYALLTGRPPHEGLSLMDVLGKLDDPVEPPSQVNPDVPVWVDSLVALALDPEPGRRPGVAAFVAGLQAKGSGGRSRAPLVAGLSLIALLGIFGLSAVGVARPEPAAVAPTQPNDAPDSDETAPPSEAMAAFDEGFRHLEAKRWAEARDAFDLSIVLDPTVAQTYYNRGVARSKLGDDEGAIEDYDEALRRQPGIAEAHVNRGSARGTQGDKRAQIEDCTEAIRLKPDLVQAYTHRASARASVGEYRGAIEDYERALELEPGAVWATKARHQLELVRKLTRQEEGESP